MKTKNICLTNGKKTLKRGESFLKKTSFAHMPTSLYLCKSEIFR